MTKIDEYVIARFTVAYLWLLDWTGIYVGSVGFVFIVLDVGWHEIVLTKSTVYWILMIVFGLLWGGYTWHLQHAAKHEKFNVDVQRWTEGPIRKIMTVIMLVVVTLDLATGQWALAAGWLPFTCWVYLCCVPIRDREKKQLEFGRRLATAKMGGGK